MVTPGTQAYVSQIQDSLTGLSIVTALGQGQPTQLAKSLIQTNFPNATNISLFAGSSTTPPWAFALDGATLLIWWYGVLPDKLGKVISDASSPRSFQDSKVGNVLPAAADGQRVIDADIPIEIINQTYSIRAWGYSLGSAILNVYAQNLSQLNGGSIPITLTTYGGPKPFWSPFQVAPNVTYWHWANATDYVPLVPPSSGFFDYYSQHGNPFFVPVVQIFGSVGIIEGYFRYGTLNVLNNGSVANAYTTDQLNTLYSYLTFAVDSTVQSTASFSGQPSPDQQAQIMSQRAGHNLSEYQSQLTQLLTAQLEVVNASLQPPISADMRNIAVSSENISEQDSIYLQNSTIGASNMSAAVGFKITHFFQDGSRGWSSTHYSASQYLAVAKIQAEAIRGKYMACFGHTSTGSGGSKGSPTCTFYRISPINQALPSYLYEVPQDLRNSTVYRGVGLGAEPPAVCLSNRITVANGSQTSSRVELLRGIPDDLIVDELYIPPIGGDQDEAVQLAQFQSNIKAFMKFLQSGGESSTTAAFLEVLAEDTAAPAGGLTSATYTDAGFWQINASGLGAASGGYTALAANDRIVLERATNGWNGSWKIKSVDAVGGTITLATGPTQGTPPMTSGQWRKSYDFSTKKVCKVFIPYTSALAWTTPVSNNAQYIVKSHKVGPVFTNSRGSKRRKRVVNA